MRRNGCECRTMRRWLKGRRCSVPSTRRPKSEGRHNSYSYCWGFNLRRLTGRTMTTNNCKQRHSKPDGYFCQENLQKSFGNFSKLCHRPHTAARCMMVFFNFTENLDGCRDLLNPASPINDLKNC